MLEIVLKEEETSHRDNTKYMQNQNLQSLIINGFWEVSLIMSLIA